MLVWIKKEEECQEVTDCYRIGHEQCSLRKGAYDHPAVVLGFGQRPGSSIERDLVCMNECSGMFNQYLTN